MSTRQKRYMILVRHVEKSERKKFRKVPTLHRVQRAGPTVAHNEVRYVVLKKGKRRKMGRVVSAKITASRSFLKGYRSGYVGSVLCHELRENLRMQHGAAFGTKRKLQRGLHRKVAHHYKGDERWVKRRFGVD